MERKHTKSLLNGKELMEVTKEIEHASVTVLTQTKWVKMGGGCYGARPRGTGGRVTRSACPQTP